MKSFVYVLETIWDVCFILLCVIILIYFINGDTKKSEHVLFAIAGISIAVQDVHRIQRKRRRKTNEVDERIDYKAPTKLAERLKCPQCGEDVDLDENEMNSKRFTCPWCDKMIDIN